MCFSLPLELNVYLSYLRVLFWELLNVWKFIFCSLYLKKEETSIQYNFKQIQVSVNTKCWLRFTFSLVLEHQITLVRKLNSLTVCVCGNPLSPLPHRNNQEAKYWFIKDKFKSECMSFFFKEAVEQIQCCSNFVGFTLYFHLRAENKGCFSVMCC